MTQLRTLLIGATCFVLGVGSTFYIFDSNQSNFQRKTLDLKSDLQDTSHSLPLQHENESSIRSAIMQTNGTKQLTNSLELRIAALEEELVKQQSEFEQALSELVQDTEKALQQKVEKENLNKSLRAENSDLAAELDAKDSQAAQEHIEEAITHASEAPSTVADNEIKQLIAAPFADIVTGAPEELKLLFKKVREPEDDYQWNFEMEAQITDFIATHENSRGIELDDVKCNVGICEIKGFETEFNAWRKVIIDMESQPWWQFKNSSSRTTDENQEYLYFYLLAAL